MTDGLGMRAALLLTAVTVTFWFTSPELMPVSRTSCGCAFSGTATTAGVIASIVGLWLMPVMVTTKVRVTELRPPLDVPALCRTVRGMVAGPLRKGVGVKMGEPVACGLV